MNAPVTKPANLADSWHQHTLRGNTEFQLACYDDALHLQELWQEFVAAYEKLIPDACRDTYREGNAVLAGDLRRSVLH